jgi:hypothetical protein
VTQVVWVVLKAAFKTAQNFHRFLQTYSGKKKNIACLGNRRRVPYKKTSRLRLLRQLRLHEKQDRMSKIVSTIKKQTNIYFYNSTIESDTIGRRVKQEERCCLTRTQQGCERKILLILWQHHILLLSLPFCYWTILLTRNDCTASASTTYTPGLPSVGSLTCPIVASTPLPRIFIPPPRGILLGNASRNSTFIRRPVLLTMQIFFDP